MAENRFKHVMSGRDILVVAFGAMIGWSWVISSGRWIQASGVMGTVIGFVVGGIMVFFVGMTYAELTAAIPKTGGEHVFSYKAFGPTGSFICTWALILSYVGVVCFEAASVPAFVQYIFPFVTQGYLYTVAGSDIYLTSIIIASLFTFGVIMINILGIKTAAVFQTILTAAIVAAGLTLAAVSAINGEWSNLEGQLFTGYGSRSIRNILPVALVAPFYLFGFDVIPQISEEASIPLRKMAGIMLFSIVSAVAFYSLVTVAVGYALDQEEISATLLSSEMVTAAAMEKMVGSTVMTKVLIFGGLCGLVTSWNAFLIGGSRAVFSMAESYMLPGKFSVLSKRRNTPVSARLLIGTLSLAAPFFGQTMLVWISNASSFACCIAYCMVAASFLILREKEPDMPRPYRIRNFRFVGVLAIVLSGLMSAIHLIPGSGSALTVQEWMIIGGWTALGFIFYIASKKRFGEKFGRTDPEEGPGE